ncbi:hypothetical protein CAPTEDRAFT_192013 [Capitella teleta]|uniref:Uncharacterized protein n=1 Tax=Capitella teleta TaxID=283909 RepID=R7TGD1_CAPTE|nr:hypothetical protein CAPTEDRAFT_192013 [Capitella teleta]|eukprot:ELT90626.1 hypothetical protein CAPTEDRAFT_192013 [Capitella teleta]
MSLIIFISNVDRKKIMVTGCDSGFGRLFAIRMANKGVTVFASCMTDDGKKQLEQSSTNIKAFIMDITDVDSVQKAYEFVTGHLASNEDAVYTNEVLESMATSNLDAAFDAYEHALFGRYPRARYFLMPSAKLFLLVPEYVLDFYYNHRITKPEPRLIS